MKRLATLFLFGVLSVTLLTGAAQAKVQLGVDAAGRFQALESTNAAGADQDESYGFGSERANIHIYGDVADGVDVYTEAYINPSTASPAINDAGDLRFSEGYITFTNLTDHPISVTAGAFEVDFGDQHLNRSDNGQVMDNPLVGNYLVDPRAVQSGVELSGTYDALNYAIAVTNGVADLQGTLGSGNQFTADDREFAYSAKVWGTLAKDLRGSASFYTTDQSDAIATAGGGAAVNPGLRSNLFGQQRSIYQGLVAANTALNPALGTGADVKAYQLDTRYKGFERTTLRAHYGNLKEDGGQLAGVTDQDWSYYGLEAVRDLTPQTHVAARYSSAEDDDAATTTEFEKIQLGVGHELTRNTILKAEWVDQDNESAGSDAGFDGFVTEVGVSF